MLKKSFAFTLVLFLLTTSCAVVIKPVWAVAEDSWVTKAPMPTARSNLGLAVLDGKIYAVGGYPTRSANEQYNPVNNTWTSKAPMPTGSEIFGIAVCENKIYVIGGSTDEMASGVTGVNEVYDPATDTWETKAPMPTPRFELQANAVNGKIYLMGGRTGGPYSTVNKTEVYDPATDSWTTKAPMPYPVVLYASAVVNDKIYIIGGQDEFSSAMNLNTTQIYNPATDMWSLGTNAPTAIWQAAAGATTGIAAPKRIYVMGGQEGFMQPLSQNYVYDPEADVWSNGTSMPTPRFTLGIAVVNDMLYAIGGHGGDFGVVYEVNEQYTPFGYAAPTTPSPSPSPSPSPASSEPTTPLPSQNLTPTPKEQEFAQNTEIIYAVAATAVIIVIVAIAAFMLRRRKQQTL